MADLDIQWAQEALQIIVGQRLTSVEFVMDYIQLRFDGPVLTVLSPVTVTTDELEIRSGEAGFRDCLCERIAARVTSARIVPHEALQLEFEDEARIRISLRPADYDVEAVLFNSDSTWWSI